MVGLFKPMPKNFADRLLGQIRKLKNPSCVGLDPRFELLPDFLKGSNKPQALFNFNKKIIDATFDLIPVYKIQVAFYEVYGSKGFRALERTISYLKKKKKIIIVDAKRNDIGSTAQAYCQAYLSKKGLDVDALTVNPYLGWDSLEPFIEVAKRQGKGLFVLTKTSNPSSADFQDLKMKNGKRLYEVVGGKINEWNRGTEGKSGYGIVGAVVGATYPQEIKKLRKIMPRSIFLLPGYGAQGGSAKDVVFAFDKEGKGAIINSSRGIIFSYKNHPYKERFSSKKFYLAARQAVIDMREDIVGKLNKRD